ncbi:hypothetical protein JOE40_004172 [Arthrobacter sp. PvP102]|nr:hypothetical protein [Arthrobacter sp. PvP103]MBP1239663.1 hypothetical protein [Arthrobacter sp. PvP102]
MDLKPFITGRIALEDLVEQGFDTLINHKDAASSSFLFLRCRAPM